MNKITVRKNNTIIAEGVIKEGKEVEAFKEALKTFERIPEATFEITKIITDEGIEEIKKKGLFFPYKVGGTIKIGSLTCKTTVEILAISADEALKKAKTEGLINPYINYHNCSTCACLIFYGEDGKSRRTWLLL